MATADRGRVSEQIFGWDPRAIGIVSLCSAACPKLWVAELGRKAFCLSLAALGGVTLKVLPRESSPGFVLSFWCASSCWFW